MKMPYRTLAILMLFVGSPFGLMQLTTRAIENPNANPLPSTAPDLGFAFYSTVGRSLSKTAMNPVAIHEAVGVALREAPAIRDWQSLPRVVDEKCKACLAFAARETLADKRKTSSDRPLTGVVSATQRAMASSWGQWQPTLVALPGQLRELRRHLKLTSWRDQAQSYVASRPPVATRSPLPSMFLETPTAPVHVTFPRAATSSSTEFVATIRSIPPHVWRSMAVSSTRLAAQVAAKWPSPLMGVARLVDEFSARTGLIHAPSRRIGASDE